MEANLPCKPITPTRTTPAAIGSGNGGSHQFFCSLEKDVAIGTGELVSPTWKGTFCQRRSNSWLPMQAATRVTEVVHDIDCSRPLGRRDARTGRNSRSASESISVFGLAALAFSPSSDVGKASQRSGLDRCEVIFCGCHWACRSTAYIEW